MVDGDGGIEPSTDSLPLNPASERRWWLKPILVVDGAWNRIESATMYLLLVGCVICSASGFFVRHLTAASLPWLELLPRYLTLGVAFFGASMATRRGGHIAIDILCRILPAPVVVWVRLLGELLASVICLVLGIASWDFLQSERVANNLILNMLPSWLPAVAIVLGFSVMALRFALRATQRSSYAVVILLLLVSLLALLSVGDLLPALFGVDEVSIAGLLKLSDGVFDVLPVLGPILLFTALLAGAPLFVALGGSAVLLFYLQENPIAVVPIEIYRLVEAPTLVTLPLFTLLGGVLAAGSAPARLIAVARSWIGWAPGGLAVAAVVICAFFTTFSGASGVTILALGLLLHQLLREEGYHEDLSVGLITSSGSIGLLFAPALPLIIYAIVAKVDVDDMFLAGVLPGCLLILMVAGVALLQSRKSQLKRRSFDGQEALRSLRGAWLELLLPMIVLGLLLSGYATVTEAAGVGAAYTLIVSGLVHRDVHLVRKMPRVLVDSGVLIGAVLIILGSALAFTGFLVDAEIPQMAVEWARAHIGSKWVFLLALNLMLLVVGCLLDIFSAIIVFVPLLTPVAQAFGVNPIHLGIIFLANLEIGYLTPPVGMNLFLSSFRFGKELPELWRTVLPFLLALIIALMVITYVPSLSLALLH